MIKLSKAYAFLLMFFVVFPVVPQQVPQEVPMYEFDWEELDTDYDQICDVVVYEKPSKITVWFRSVGGALYVKLCSAKEYVVAKYLALKNMLMRKKKKKNNSTDDVSALPEISLVSVDITTSNTGS